MKLAQRSIVLVWVGTLTMFSCAIFHASEAFARTYSEARSACESAGGTVEKTIPCSYVKCNVGGVLLEYEYQCQSSDSSSSSSSSSTSELVQKKREECEAKGGTFNVNSVSNGYVNSTCTMPSGGSSSSSNGAGGSSSGSASGGGYIADGSDYVSVEVTPSGFNGNMDNSVGQKDTKKCPEGQVNAGLFGGCVDASEGGIFMILNLILNVLTWGIGIAGTLGIVITGIQYMTARDNATQMEKAKHRLIQIVIGLAIYAVMWAFLQWLLPGGVFGS